MSPLTDKATECKIERIWYLSSETIDLFSPRDHTEYAWDSVMSQILGRPKMQVRRKEKQCTKRQKQRG